MTHSPLEPPSTLDTCPQPSRPYFYPSGLSISPSPHHPLLCTPQLPWRYVHFTTTTDLATCSSHPTSRSRQLRSLCSQSPPSALPSRMHPLRVAQQLFPNQKCECPTLPHPTPSLCFSALNTCVAFKATRLHHQPSLVTARTTSTPSPLPAKRHSIKSLATHLFCTGMWVKRGLETGYASMEYGA